MGFARSPTLADFNPTVQIVLKVIVDEFNLRVGDKDEQGIDTPDQLLLESNQERTASPVLPALAR